MNKLIILFLVLLIPCGVSAESPKKEGPEARINQGQAVAFDRNAGNCLSCHIIAGGELPGEVGPPLVQMKLRYPDRAVLRSQIWDASSQNSNTVMPPYGRHNILTEEELDLVVDFIHSL